MAGIVTLAVNPCVDESTEVEHVVPDRKLRCAAPRWQPGGGGINVARAIRRLGGRALAIYPAGGPAGALLRRLLDEEDVPHRPLPIQAWTRENLNVTEASTSRQFRFVFPGPVLAPADWQACLDELGKVTPPPSYLVASGSLPPGVPADFYARVARSARGIGARLLLDTSGEAARLALAEGVFLLKPSLREFQNLTGIADAEEPHLVAESERLIAEGRCEVVVLSLGPAGVLLVGDGIRERVAAPTVPVRSTVGAGDALLAGIVLSLEGGRRLREAVGFGVAAAAAAVMNPGTELCRREDAERLYSQMAPVPA